jgi:hypothetical protein
MVLAVSSEVETAVVAAGVDYKVAVKQQATINKKHQHFSLN